MSTFRLKKKEVQIQLNNCSYIPPKNNCCGCKQSYSILQLRPIPQRFKENPTLPFIGHKNKLLNTIASDILCRCCAIKWEKWTSNCDLQRHIIHPYDQYRLFIDELLNNIISEFQTSLNNECKKFVLNIDWR